MLGIVQTVPKRSRHVNNAAGILGEVCMKYLGEWF